jgi:hypothetical protein
VSTFAFTVVAYEPNKRVDIRFAVMSYQDLRPTTDLPDFDWERKNVEAPAETTAP